MYIFWQQRESIIITDLKLTRTDREKDLRSLFTCVYRP